MRACPPTCLPARHRPQGHGKAVDWWALGVLVYEMCAGYPPFYDDDPLATYKKILKGGLTFPQHFSVTARDLVRKLLQASVYVCMYVGWGGCTLYSCAVIIRDLRSCLLSTAGGSEQAVRLPGGRGAGHQEPPLVPAARLCSAQAAHAAATHQVKGGGGGRTHCMLSPLSPSGY